MEINYFRTNFLKVEQNKLRKPQRNSPVKQLSQNNKIIQENLKEIITISDVQQGSRAVRSCIDVVFIVK